MFSEKYDLLPTMKFFFFLFFFSKFFVLEKIQKIIRKKCFQKNMIFCLPWNFFFSFFFLQIFCIFFHVSKDSKKKSEKNWIKFGGLSESFRLISESCLIKSPVPETEKLTFLFDKKKMDLFYIHFRRLHMF